MLIPSLTRGGLIPRSYVPSAAGFYNRKVVVDFCAAAATTPGPFSGSGPFTIAGLPFANLSDPAYPPGFASTCDPSRGLLVNPSWASTGTWISTSESDRQTRFGVPILSLIPDLGPHDPIRLTITWDPFIRRLRDTYDGSGHTAVGFTCWPPNTPPWTPSPYGAGNYCYQSRLVRFGSQNNLGPGPIGSVIPVSTLVCRTVGLGVDSGVQHDDNSYFQARARHQLVMPHGISGQTMMYLDGTSIPTERESLDSLRDGRVVHESTLSHAGLTFPQIRAGMRMSAWYVAIAAYGSFYDNNAPISGGPGVNRLCLEAAVY